MTPEAALLLVEFYAHAAAVAVSALGAWWAVGLFRFLRREVLGDHDD